MIGGVSYYCFEITPALYYVVLSNLVFQKLSKINAYVSVIFKNYTKSRFRTFLPQNIWIEYKEFDAFVFAVSCFKYDRLLGNI